jgi:GDSL-like Lipase/Acylhydrolase family
MDAERQQRRSGPLFLGAWYIQKPTADFASVTGKNALHFRSLILLAMAAIAVGSLCYVYKVGPFRPALSRERYLSIREVVRTTPSPVIVFGDSIVEAAPLPAAICGTPVVNAGVGGADIRYVVRYSDELLGAAAPRLIVLAVGINDAHEDTFPFFRSRYQAAVVKLASRAPVLLATVAPPQRGAIAQRFVAEMVPHLNEAIKEIAGQRPVIDINEQMAGPNLTTDGIHLNAQGYELWTRAMIGGIEKALGCNAGT